MDPGGIAPGAAPAPKTAADNSKVGDGLLTLADGSTATPLATVNIEDGHTVAFYEVDGAITVLELAKPGQTLVTKTGTDVMELFEQLEPEAAPPAALIAAYDRFVAAEEIEKALAVKPDTQQFGGGASEQSTPEAELGGDLSVVGQALTSSSNCAPFVNDTEACDWASAFSSCRCNWGGGFFAQVGGASSMNILVDHYSGNGVTIRLLKDGSVTSSVGVPAGQIGQLSSSGSDATRRCEVTNASGDSFHVGCWFAD